MYKIIIKQLLESSGVKDPAILCDIDRLFDGGWGSPILVRQDDGATVLSLSNGGEVMTLSITIAKRCFDIAL